MHILVVSQLLYFCVCVHVKLLKLTLGRIDCIELVENWLIGKRVATFAELLEGERSKCEK